MVLYMAIFHLWLWRLHNRVSYLGIFWWQDLAPNRVNQTGWGDHIFSLDVWQDCKNAAKCLIPDRLPDSLPMVRRNGKGSSPKFCLVDLL